MTNNWDNICAMNESITEETEIILKRMKETTNSIINQLNNSDISVIKNGIEMLADSTYELDAYHKLCKLMIYVIGDTSKRKLWIKSDNLINIYILMHKYNVATYGKLVDILKTNKQKLDTHDIKYIEYIICDYEKRGYSDKLFENNLCKTIKTFDEIELYENKIMNNKKIATDRDTLFDTLYNIIQLRHTFANMKGIDDYFTYRTDIDTNNLKKTIKDILDNIPDDEYKTEKSNKTILFNRDKVMKKLIVITEKMFNIKITQTETKTWHKKAKLNECFYANKLIGYLYIDIEARKSKHCNTQIISLYEPCMFPQKSETIKDSVCVLLGCYNKTIDYDEITDIYKQFGNIMQILFHRSKYGNIINKNLDNTINENIFENIIKEKVNINKITQNKEHTEIIHANNKHNDILKLKNMCKIALFDYMCHSSFITNIKNGNNLMSKFTEIFGIVSDENILEIINYLASHGGQTYKLVINRLLAFNIYTKMKKYNMYEKYANYVMSNTLDPLNDTITRFAGMHDASNNNTSNNNNNNNNNNSVSKKINIVKKKTVIKVQKNNIQVNEMNYFTDN